MKLLTPSSGASRAQLPSSSLFSNPHPLLPLRSRHLSPTRCSLAPPATNLLGAPAQPPLTPPTGMFNRLQPPAPLLPNSINTTPSHPRILWTPDCLHHCDPELWINHGQPMEAGLPNCPGHPPGSSVSHPLGQTDWTYPLMLNPCLGSPTLHLQLDPAKDTRTPCCMRSAKSLLLQLHTPNRHPVHARPSPPGPHTPHTPHAT